MSRQTPEWALDMLRHMLGINDPAKRDPAPYRDYAAANPDDARLIEMKRMGLVEVYSRRGAYVWYQTTPLGRRLAIESFKHIRYGAPQRRYIAWLEVRDALPDLTFRQFLTDPEFAQIRRKA